MATLGDLLAEARRSSGRFTRWLSVADPALGARIGRAAAAAGESPAAYVRAAVAQFAAAAPEQDWSELSARLREADDPAMTCLRIMVGWRLRGTLGEPGATT